MVVSIDEEQLPIFQVVLLYMQAVPVKRFYYPDFLYDINWKRSEKFQRQCLEMHTVKVR